MSDDRAYRVVVRFEKDREQFTASVPELGVSASGATRAEAIAQAEEAIDSRLQAVADGEPAPAPIDALAAAPDLTLKLSAGTYRDLAYLAGRDGVAIEALAHELIARGLGYREGMADAAPRERPRAPAPQQAQSQRPHGARDPDAQPDFDPAQRERAPQVRRDGGGGGDRGRRQREGYRPDLDNQANFLEYARSLEKGSGQGVAPGGGNQGGRDRGGRGRGGR